MGVIGSITDNIVSPRDTEFLYVQCLLLAIDTKGFTASANQKRHVLQHDTYFHIASSFDTFDQLLCCCSIIRQADKNFLLLAEVIPSSVVLP